MLYIDIYIYIYFNKYGVVGVAHFTSYIRELVLLIQYGDGRGYPNHHRL